MIAEHNRPIHPTPADVEAARQALHGEPFARPSTPRPSAAATSAVTPDMAVVSVCVPKSVVPVIRLVLEEIARGRAFSIIPSETQLTTKEAADILGVSRPHIVKLLESRSIPFVLVGTHRRITFQDLMEYKSRMDAERQKVLDELAAKSQELGMDL